MPLVSQAKAKKPSTHATKDIAHPTDYEFQAKIAEFVDKRKPTHFIKAILFDQKSILLFEDEINAWLIRVNRSYIGRRWHTLALKNRGMVAFVELTTKTLDGHLCALMLVRPPLSADPQEFIVQAPFHFLDQMECSTRLIGEMKVQHIDVLESSPAKIAQSFIAKLAEC